MHGTLIELRDAIRTGRLSARQAVDAALARLDAAQPRLNAFLDTFHDRALAAARHVDRLRADGATLGPLAGVPVVIKDNIVLSGDAWPGGAEDGGRTTCACRFLEHYRSPFTATAARRLTEAGAIVIAKANMDEFAMGSSGENSAFGPARNPWDPTRVPGGSSSGSTAAVAAGVVPLALGSDTGGSIRQPAALCNLVGLKPTYGRVSRYGLVAYASSLDQIGPLTPTVADAALALNVLAGHDPLDATSAQRPPEDFLLNLDRPVDGLTLGVPAQARSEANHPAVAAALAAAIERFTERGARIVDIDLPSAPYGIAAYYIVATAEASSNLARFDGIRYGRRATLKPGEELEDLYARSRAEGFGPEVQRRIMLGTYVLSAGYYDAYYTTALKARRLIKGDFDRAFELCHAVLMPTSPTPAFRLGERTTDPLQMYLADVYTVSINLAGLPAVSIPGGFASVDGVDLPVGLQLVGPAWREGELLRIARAHERLVDFHTRAPR